MICNSEGIVNRTMPSLYFNPRIKEVLKNIVVMLIFFLPLTDFGSLAR